MLYRLRADGRQVPLTEGHGMNLAHRKGLIQEVVVSPKRVPQALAEANSLFGTQTTSQPENVVLHSVELPQVQLGDREVADPAPEDGDPEQQTRQRVPQTLDLPAHPALLHLQQQRMQPHLLTNSGTHSAPLGDVASQQAVSRINSLSSLSSENLRASELELSNHAAAALQAQHASTMPQWGLPQGGVALSGNPLDPNRSHSAHLGYTNQAILHPHGAHGSLPRSALLTSPAVHHSAPLGTGQPGFRRMPLVSHSTYLRDAFSNLVCGHNIAMSSTKIAKDRSHKVT